MAVPLMPHGVGVAPLVEWRSRSQRCRLRKKQRTFFAGYAQALVFVPGPPPWLELQIVPVVDVYSEEIAVNGKDNVITEHGYGKTLFEVVVCGQGVFDENGTED